MEMVFGIETEYGWSCGQGRGRAGLDGFMRKARDVITVSDPRLNASRFWTGNGGLFYPDCGHPEFASPECMNPTDLVIYAEAIDRILLRMKVANGDIVSKINVSQSGNANWDDDEESNISWGAHESYMYRDRGLPEKWQQLATHLATRVIFSGTGGFKNTSNRFTISPRAQFVNGENGAESTSDRSICDSREDPLSETSYRQHVLCGEPNCSQLSLYLKVGSTALVVAMIDRGIDLQRVVLSSPSRKLSEVADDIEMKKQYTCYNGQELTANEIQHFYMQKVRENLDVLPEWADGFCDVWEDTLIRLRGGWEAVLDRIDWAIKYAVFRSFVSSNKANPDDLRFGFSDYANTEIRDSLRELDWKYGQLGDGIFVELDKVGVLDHKIEGVTDEAIEYAVDNPPKDTRAKIRGEAVKSGVKHESFFWEAIRFDDHILRMDEPTSIEGISRDLSNIEVIREHYMNYTWRTTNGNIVRPCCVEARGGDYGVFCDEQHSQFYLFEEMKTWVKE